MDSSGKDFTEFKVVVSDDEQKLTQKFPLYHDGIRISHDDETLSRMVNETKLKFKGSPTKIEVYMKYIWDEYHG